MRNRTACPIRARPQHIFKAQYTEGFRPPTFWELFAPGFRDAALDFEVMRTLEAGYVYRRPGTTGRLTVFHSEIDDLIYPVLPPPGPGPTIFRNNSRADMDGFELELERKESEEFWWQANLSNVDTFDSRTTSGPAGDSAVAADWMGNLALFYRFEPERLLTSRFLHVGERHTVAGQSSGYDTLDVTLTLDDAPARGWTLRLGARNLLDNDVRHLLAFPGFTQEVPWHTQTVWAQLSHAF